MVKVGSSIVLEIFNNFAGKGEVDPTGLIKRTAYIACKTQSMYMFLYMFLKISSQYR
jgi:hypothetical protein